MPNLSVEPYSCTVFNKLPLLEAAPEDSVEVLLAIRDVGNFIKSHGYADVVALGLLHRHFALNHGERVVEVLEQRRSVISPAAEDPSELAVPYFYMFEQRGLDSYHLHPLEYVLLPSASSDAKRDIEKVLRDTAFLVEFGKKLSQHGLLNTHGLFLHHRPNLPANSQTLETSGVAARELHVRPIEECDTTGLDVLRTSVWDFRAQKDGLCGHSSCGHVSTSF